jgi:hypothetical protein
MKQIASQQTVQNDQHAEAEQIKKKLHSGMTADS